ncbi:MAG: HupE/UreJ family protein [Chromatiaceae bacterium]|jgi:hydrogenase/urease accessory protein HupE|nr:HupE/UreJ family protein [Chromatiaceae bacterium]
MSVTARLLTAALLLVAGAFGSTPRVSAHQFAPALLELVETATDRVDVSWKQPMIRVQGSRLRPVLPVECEGIGDPVVTREGTGARARWEIACPNGLAGKSVGVEDIGSSRANVLLRVALRDGRSLRQVLTAEAPSFEIPAKAGQLGVFESYGRLGIEHILSGADHLLFVLALVLLVGWGRVLLWTVTAFTAGHSVTLALATLGFVDVPQGLTEAAIALSIYFLAVELVRSLDGNLTITQRAPWVIAFTFGLLHGLGFAGALAEVGLPRDEIPTALFAFNVGIELGQLAFVASVLAVRAAIRTLPVSQPKWSGIGVAYGIGSIAIYWFFQRVTVVGGEFLSRFGS